MAKGKRKRGGSTLDSSPSHLLHRVLQVALDVYAEETANGLTQRQFAVLTAVAENEGLTQTDLVRITGIDRSTLADMAARMIAKGLLERQRSETDARANAVSLTEAGRLALAEAQPKMAAADARLLKLVSSGKRETLVGVLRDLVKAGEEAAEPAAEKPAKAPKAPKAAKAPKAEKPKKGKKLKKAA